MNREAAALRVPVYSIFRGKTGAVDAYLEADHRLTMVRSVEQVRELIRLIPRNWSQKPALSESGAMQSIVAHIKTALAESIQKSRVTDQR
jgi:predicted glycosyltransferase